MGNLGPENELPVQKKKMETKGNKNHSDITPKMSKYTAVLGGNMMLEQMKVSPLFGIFLCVASENVGKILKIRGVRHPGKLEKNEKFEVSPRKF